MFLKPQHFQLSQRHTSHLVHVNTKWNDHFTWGLRHIEIDFDALSNRRFCVRTIQARLRDGTLVQMPRDKLPAPLDLGKAFENESHVLVYLGVPRLFEGKAAVAEAGNTDGARFQIEVREVPDENTGEDPEAVEVLVLNYRFLLSTDDLQGYDLLPLARIEPSADSGASPQLDETYIPPLLTCDAWEPLRAGILQVLSDRVGKKIDLLVKQVVGAAIPIGASSPTDAILLAQLRELNEAVVLLRFLAFTPGIHPLTAFLELCLLVGRLAIFSEARRVPELPLYDHDDLGGCFFRVKQHLDALLNVIMEVGYGERPFIGHGLQIRVNLDPAWLEPDWELYLAVYHTNYEREECLQLLQMLDYKIGPIGRVDEMFRQGQGGLQFENILFPPQPLPATPKMIYFRPKQKADPLWRELRNSHILALRLNEKHIVGNIQGQRRITILQGQRRVGLEFTLYAVRAAGGASRKSAPEDLSQAASKS
jgi:type VI secretion system protein ImpJ